MYEYYSVRLIIKQIAIWKSKVFSNFWSIFLNNCQIIQQNAVTPVSSAGVLFVLRCSGTCLATTPTPQVT